MDKNYFKAIDNLTAPETAVEKALTAARKAQSGKVIEMKKHGKIKQFTLIGAAAAALALVIGLGSMFNHVNPGAGIANSFTITANAAEFKSKLGDDSIIGVFDGDGGSGWMLDSDNMSDDIYESGTYYKDGFIDTFWEFNLSTLRIRGKNIKSVSLCSRNNGVYFGITPTSGVDYDSLEFDKDGEGYFENDRSFFINREQVKELERMTKEKSNCYTYSETVSTSQYSKAEFKKYADGFGGENVCDRFTFTNKKGEDEINLDRDINLIAESIHSNPKIAKLLKQFRENEKQKLDAKVAHDEDTLNFLYEKENKLYDKIIRETVAGAKLTLTVCFTDGSSQSKTLNLSYTPIKDDYNFPCVTFK